MPVDRTSLIRFALLAVGLFLPVLVVCGDLEIASTGAPCTSNDECPQGTICVIDPTQPAMGSCQIACNSDDDCVAGTSCSRTRDICMAPCTRDEECGSTSDTACVDGSCEFLCEADADPDCPGDRPVCDEDGICVECATDGDCDGEDGICLGGECATGCREDADCGDLQVCDPADFVCVDVECMAEGDCPTGNFCDADGTCQPIACGDAGAPACEGACPAGEACVLDEETLEFCHCSAPPAACGDAAAPACDGACPADEECLSDPFEEFCVCVGADFPCTPEDLPADLCIEAQCPVGRRCAAVAGGCRCVEPAAAGLVGAQGIAPFFYGVDKNPTLELDPPTAGASAEQRLSFDVTVGELETFRAEIVYPPGFGFAGFLSLGPQDTPVGSYGFDADGDGNPETAVPLRALKHDTAYADATLNGRFEHGRDPIVEVAGDPILTATLPLGGDGDPNTLTARSPARRVVVLFAGLFSNPPEAGEATLGGCFTSVDPDTDGADDGMGEPAQGFCEEFAVEIEGNAGPLAVEIDIRPHAPKNVVNPRSHGFVGVALLGSASFDVDDVETSSLAFGSEGAPLAFQLPFPRDLNRDGHGDLRGFYHISQTGIAAGDTQACLRGETWDGTVFEGCDAIATCPEGHKKSPSGPPGCPGN